MSAESLTPAAKRSRWIGYAFAGTAAAVLIGGVALQLVRPPAAYPEGAKPQAAAPAAKQQVTTKVMARVNRGVITYDELAAECVAQFGPQVLEDMINRTIIRQACDAQGIAVSEQEVTDEIVKTAEKFSLAPDQFVQFMATERNIPLAKFRNEVIWPKLALQKLAGESVNISGDDLKKAFIRNYGERVKARIILMDHPRRAKEVWEEVVKNPDEFGRIAREKSMDPQSRPLEGQIPPIPRYAGNPELEKAAFKLKEGEISGIIQLDPQRYVILKSEGRTEQIVTNIADVEEDLRKQLQEEKVQEMVASVFEKLKAEARVDNHITNTTSAGSGKKTAANPSDDGEVKSAGGRNTGRGRVQPAVGDQQPGESGN